MSPATRENPIIVALDRSDIDEVRALVKELTPWVGAFKVGLELITSYGAPLVVEEVSKSGGKIFFDGKFKDIPNTVAGAARAVTRLGVWMFNVHCLGGAEMMAAARRAAEDEAGKLGLTRPLVIGVTILTSLDVAALAEIGFSGLKSGDDLKNLVIRLAQLAKQAGLDGVVASPKEAAAIKTACGDDFLVVTPGIRPAWAAAGDQKRIEAPADALQSGSDYLVIGRPITSPPKEIGGPKVAVQKILEEINI